jgi:hypothetical protein
VEKTDMKRPEDICPDFPRWPESWMGTKEDIPFGQGLVDSMRPFVEDLIARGLSDKTIRRHMDNLWLLGGEIIRDVSMADGTSNTTRSPRLRNSASPSARMVACSTDICILTRIKRFIMLHAGNYIVSLKNVQSNYQ